MSHFRAQKQKTKVKYLDVSILDCTLISKIFIFIQNSFLFGRSSSKTSDFAVGTPF